MEQLLVKIAMIMAAAAALLRAVIDLWKIGSERFDPRRVSRCRQKRRSKPCGGGGEEG